MGEIVVGSFEAKNRLSHLLDRVAAGSRVTITKRGKPVALLISASTDTAADLVAAFRIFRARAKSAPESLKSLIEEGRR